MREIEHPSVFIKKELTDSIRAVALESESLRKLHPDQLSIIHQEKWFSMFVPKIYGGLEFSLPEGVKIEEALSCADGSTGWVVTLCSGAAWFVGFLNKELSDEVFSDVNVCFAGSGAPTGTAQLTKNGYKVSGYWKYASGSLHATVFTANCVLINEGKTVLQEDGVSVIQSFLFKKDEVQIHATWKSMGMMATGSHDFEVKNITIPQNRSFFIDAKHAIIKNTFYRYPFRQLAAVTLTANLSGMAIRFLDLCGILFNERNERNQYTESQGLIRFQKLEKAMKALQYHRQSFYEALETSWSICDSGKTIPAEQLGQVSECSYQLATASRNMVDELYPYCGLIATNLDLEINRVWRNFHTATQHSMFTDIP